MTNYSFLAKPEAGAGGDVARLKIAGYRSIKIENGELIMRKGDKEIRLKAVES